MMFRCLSYLQFAFIVMMITSSAQAHICFELFSPWPNSLSAAWKKGQNLLDSETLSWIASVAEKLGTARTIGILSPTYPATQGRLLGNKTAIDWESLRQNNPDKKTDTDLMTLRESLDWENASAEILRNFNFYVVQNPDTSDVFKKTYPDAKAKARIPNYRRPDYFILNRGLVTEGRVFDHYFAKADLPNLMRGILSKTSTDRHQTTRVVVNLCRNSFFNQDRFNLSDLRKALRELSVDDNLEEVIVIHGTSKENIRVERVFP